MDLSNDDADDEVQLLLRKHAKLINNSLDVMPGDYAAFHNTKCVPRILFGFRPF